MAETRRREPGRGAEADGGRGAARSSGACRSGRRRPRATRKRAKPSASHRSRSARRLRGLRRSTRRPRADLDAQQAQLGVLRQQRETLQQEAAQMTAELAGLEERRRGAEASFPAHRPAPCRSRAPRADHRAAARSGERGARAAHRRERRAREARRRNSRTHARRRWLWCRRLPSRRRRCGKQLAELETELKTGARRARPVARRPRGALERAGQAALRSGAS